MERDCFVGETPVTLHNGLSVMIKNMSSENYELYGWDNKNKGMIKSKQLGFEYKGKRECVKLTFEDGRTLTCTREHPFLTKDNKWIEAKDLIVNNTRVKSSLIGVLINEEKEIEQCKDWKLNAGIINLDCLTLENYRKSLAFARLIGYLITDGNLFKDDKNGVVYAGHPLDIKQLESDLSYFKSINSSAKIIDRDNGGNVARIYLGKDLANSISSLKGIHKGAKINKEFTLPQFILDSKCPIPIIREFLAGLFGGDGHTCVLGMHRGKRDLLTSVSFSQSKTINKVNSLVETMENINKLLVKCGVNNITIQNPKETTSSKNNEKKTKVVSVVLHVNKSSLLEFTEKIGFRYCCHKSQRLIAGYSYEKLRTIVRNQRLEILEKASKLLAKRITQKEAINLAVKQCDLINDYSIPTTSALSEYIKGSTEMKFRSDKFPTAENYLKSIGALEWFIDNDDCSCHGVNINKKVIPTMNLMLINKTITEEKDVYDIEVAKTRSFLANGMVAHNCVIAHGMAQFLKERMMETADAYETFVCNNCGLFAQRVRRDDNSGTHKEMKDQWVCKLPKCRGHSVSMVRVPYAFKLLLQEMMAMCIAPRIRFKKDTFE